MYFTNVNLNLSETMMIYFILVEDGCFIEYSFPLYGNSIQF